MKRLTHPLVLICVAAGGWAIPALSETERANVSAPIPEKIEFNRDVRPLLSDKCFHCHGPDPKTRKAKLRLDLSENAYGDLGGTVPIVPGNLDKSEVFHRIMTDDLNDVMPPADSGKSLTEADKTILKRWIEQGAEYQDHWAFIKPTERPLPVPGQTGEVRNWIDNYVLARLEKEGLEPNPEAARTTLIRRVTFDLTGLPPTPEEVEAFLSDTETGAYQRLVDRLLKSPRYGEHMARYWLDAARYGDTHGLHLDNYREMWPYRDWVINAFNENMSFRDFTVHQLAGDLLPDGGKDELIATGFNRSHVTTAEGGSIEEEVRIRNVGDRTSTTGTVFMGLTVGCAACHDHKYDPITQKEYYQLSAFFNSIDGNPMDGNVKDHPPSMKVATPEQELAMESVRNDLEQVNDTLAKHVASVEYEEPALPDEIEEPTWEEVVWLDDELPSQAAVQDGEWPFVEAPHPIYSGMRSHLGDAKGLDQHFFVNAEPLLIGEGDRLFTYVYLDPERPPREIMLQWNDGEWDHRAYWGENVIDWGKDGTSSRRHMGDLPGLGQWVRLEIDAAAVGLEPGAKVHGWAFTQFDGQVYWDKAGIVTRENQTPHYDSMLVWETFQRSLEDPKLPKGLTKILRQDPRERKVEDQKRLRDYFIEYVYAQNRNVIEPLHEEKTQLEKRLADMEADLPSTLIWKEREEPLTAHVLNRGEYDEPGEEAPRAVPAFLPALPEGKPVDRLALAEWLVDPSHPLTARVTVNRFWQQLFGVGIVKTSEDFGSQGEWPSHPELLDHLALWFQENDWDVKELMRLMVSSATYRQSSRITPESFARDPENRLLARGPRFRLDAEMLRDQALAVSGLLKEEIGGPSVKPPQPEGLWEIVGYSGSNTLRFEQDHGPKKVHRRSLYTFWKRTAPPPQMNTFDAPSRETCIVRRERTNTPLQALLLLNDPQYYEAARSLAEDMVHHGGDDPASIAQFGFQRATGRTADTEELLEMTELFEDYRSHFETEPEAAKKSIQVGEIEPDPSIDPVTLAAWTLVANLILNLDEVVTKG